MSDAPPALRARCHGLTPGSGTWPSVSVIVPVRNEGPHLARAVASILGQEYPEPFDVCLAVAPSDDDTAEVAARLAADHQRVSIVDNPSGSTPAGLNAAIGATAGSIVVRVDGHAELSDGYIRRAVETMGRTGAVNVGGRQLPKPETRFEAAVAAATTSWMGTGGATYRVGGAEGAVDTVYLGVFDRSAGDAVGWFDETLVRNQDYELNIRLRQAGGIVFFDPELAVGYRPRGSWGALARQYYEYGWWKAEVVRRHPGSLRLRQVLPPVAIGLGVVLVGMSVRWRRLRAPVVIATGTYSCLTTASAPRGGWRTLVIVPTIHIAWSIGLCRSALSGRLRAPNRTVRARADGPAGPVATPSAT